MACLDGKLAEEYVLASGEEDAPSRLKSYFQGSRYVAWTLYYTIGQQHRLPQRKKRRTFGVLVIIARLSLSSRQSMRTFCEPPLMDQRE